MFHVLVELNFLKFYTLKHKLTVKQTQHKLILKTTKRKQSNEHNKTRTSYIVVCIMAHANKY